MMNHIIFISVAIILPSVPGQFNTNQFGQYPNQGNNPFGGNQQYGQDQSFAQGPTFGVNNPYDFRPDLGRGFGNDIGSNPYNTYQMSLEGSLRCPQHWVQFQQSCYRFIKSPIRARNDARRNCQAYESDLVSIDSLEEHGFIIYQLLWQDPQHRKWYTSIRQQGPNYWVNDGDGTPLVNMENAFLATDQNTYGKDFIVYRYWLQF